MKTLEEIKNLIDVIDPNADDQRNMEKMAQVCDYAGLYAEYHVSDDTTRASVYGEAVRRITSLYRPDAAHFDAYTNGCDEPATFEDIKTLYREWGTGRTMTFEEFFDTWETIQA